MIRTGLSRAALLVLLAAGCSGYHDQPPPVPGLALFAPATGNPVRSHVTHVVVIVQENRSFENFFAGFPGANAPLQGSAGGKTVKLHQITFNGPNITHTWRSSMTEWDNGAMDGFYQFGKNKKGQYAAYAFLRHDLIAPYWTMAQQYVLADAMFPTEFGGSFTGHLTLIAGNDDLSPDKAEVDVPSDLPDDCDSPPGTTSSYLTPDRVEHGLRGPFPCFDQFTTMAESLDHAGVSWKYYASQHLNAGMWSPFEAIRYVRYGQDWDRNIIAPETTVLSDISNGQLASVSWVSPSEEDSDHPESRSDRGPSWVASVVNAIGESPYWKSTAIVVLWDDWGGWYDNAPPPQLDYRGLGMRVPCIIIGAYARAGYVSHTTYEFGSVLKFIEQAFDLPYLGNAHHGYTDERANSLVDSFDFMQKARTFQPITTKYGRSTFIHEPPSNEPVDTE